MKIHINARRKKKLEIKTMKVIHVPVAVERDAMVMMKNIQNRFQERERKQSRPDN